MPATGIVACSGWGKQTMTRAPVLFLAAGSTLFALAALPGSAVAGVAPPEGPGVDCSEVPFFLGDELVFGSPKNLGQLNKLFKEQTEFNNLNQYAQQQGQPTGSSTQQVLAVCGVGSQGDEPVG